MQPVSCPLRSQTITIPFKGSLTKESPPVGDGGTPVDPILESISVSAAFATVKLRAAYAGQCVRLRRSSDNAESDFGFTALNVLDVSAISTWLAGSNGFLATYYDQSGSGIDAIQGTAANQPQYREVGIGGYPDFIYDGTDYLTFNAFAALVTGSDIPFTVFTLGDTPNQGTNDRLWAVGLSSDNAFYHTLGTTSLGGSTYRSIRRVNAAIINADGGVFSTAPHILTASFAGTTISMWLDTIQIVTDSAMNTASLTLNRASIGTSLGSSAVGHWTGNISLIIANGGAELSSVNRATIDSNIASVYGI